MFEYDDSDNGYYERDWYSVFDNNGTKKIRYEGYSYVRDEPSYGSWQALDPDECPDGDCDENWYTSVSITGCVVDVSGVRSGLDLINAPIACDHYYEDLNDADVDNLFANIGTYLPIKEVNERTPNGDYWCYSSDMTEEA